jgi:hypothetical protein
MTANAMAAGFYPAFAPNTRLYSVANLSMGEVHQIHSNNSRFV